jgi:hypothetical protein
MKVTTAFDQVMFAATVGVEPDDEDLAAVKPTPGADPAAFRHAVKAKAREIADLKRSGNHGDARHEATAAAAAYAAAFAAFLPDPIDKPPPVEDITDLGALGERMFRL